MNKRIKLTNEMVELIRNNRAKYGISAKKLTEICGQRPGWISNIENKRTTTITYENMLKICDILLKKEEENEFTAYIEQQLGLQNDECYLEFRDREYERLKYSYKNQSKELRREISLSHKSLLHLLDKIDFNEPTTIEKYQPYINTFIGLLSSTSGKKCFSRLFKYPLHMLSDDIIDKIEPIIKSELSVEYKLSKDLEFNEYKLSLGCSELGEEDLFE